MCNFLGLARRTGEHRYHELAVQLIEQVHQTLGRHRTDDPRTGWISGFDEKDGAAHPTQGGLRIGKELPERGPHDPFDERLEWERDGQYFHYLTKWMHALDQAARAAAEPVYNRWARELADGAYAAFTYVGPGNRRRMYWKMSIDLSRPLVAAMGQHDPIDGYITAAQLRATASLLDESAGPDLGNEIRGFAAMIDRNHLATVDPLGLGGLLMDAARVEQLLRREAPVDDELLPDLLEAALIGLEQFTRSGELHLPARRRLAFRELGLAIGLQGIMRMRERLGDKDAHLPGGSTVPRYLESLQPFTPVAEEIESFWRRPAHRRTATWKEHQDINSVMLATALVPDGFLVPGSSR